eukprot:Em0346g4a
MKIGSGFTPDDNSRPEKRRTSDLVRVFEQNDSIINRLYLSDHNFQAVYNVCAVHVVLLAISKVLFDSLAAGRLFVDLHLVHFAFGYFNLAGIATFILIELLLLSMAVSVHPALMVWKLVRTKFPSFKVDLAFLLVYVLGIASSVVLVLWVGFEVRLGFALSITITTEQVRLIMKTYSYVRETAKKVLTPWNKDDTSGPAVVYAGQMEPKVGSLANYLYFLFAPTLLYRDRYPRNDGPINWKNVIVYLSQFVAIFLTIMVIYQDLAMPPSLSLADVLKSLVYSLVAGFAHIAIFNVGVIHSWMNLHAELLRFADRQFNSDWWTAVSYPVYYRKCNAVIYDWIHAYMYTDVKNGTHNQLSFFAFFIIGPVLSAIQWLGQLILADTPSSKASTWMPDGAPVDMFQPEHPEECCVVPQHHPHASNGMMSKGVKGIVRAKCNTGILGSVHTKPPFYGNLMDWCIKM